MPRYKLSTLLIVLALGLPVLAWAWLNRMPLGISLALVLSACIPGIILGRTLLWGIEGLLWGIEGLLAVAASLIATLRLAMRDKTPDITKMSFR